MSDFEALLEFEQSGNHTPDERNVIQDYKTCLGEGNANRVALYLQFGPTIRHRVMNMNSYQHNLKFGFAHKELDNNNWLIRGKFDIERIEFDTTQANDNSH